MKKWIAAAFAILLAWNIWLSVEVTSLRRQESETPNTNVTNTNITNYTTDLSRTAQRNYASVVTVVSDTLADPSYSSGLIYAQDESGVYIFTDASNLNDAERCSVIFDSGRAVEAEILARDKDTGAALLRVQPAYEVTPFVIGDSDTLEQGEYVLVMGGRRPDTGTGTVSFGIVSEPGQRKMTLYSTWIANIIETDTSVTGDCYGGPLLNVGGELVGMVVTKPQISQDKMGYALSVNEMKMIFTEIMENGHIERGSIGAVVRNVSEMRAYEKSSWNITLDTTTGVMVTSVYTGSAADGILRPGDVIVSLNGEATASSTELRSILYGFAVDETVALRLIRDTEEIEESVTLR